MYKVTLSRGYREFEFLFESMETAGIFMETALKTSTSEIEFKIEVYKEESEEESNDTN